MLGCGQESSAVEAVAFAQSLANVRNLDKTPQVKDSMEKLEIHNFHVHFVERAYGFMKIPRLFKLETSDPIL